MQILFTYTLFINTLRKAMNITCNNLDSYFLNNGTLKCPSLTHNTNLPKKSLHSKKSLSETDLQLSVPTVCWHHCTKLQKKKKLVVVEQKGFVFVWYCRDLSLVAALAKLTQDSPRHQPPVLLGGLFTGLGAGVSWRERKGLPRAGRKPE